MLAKTVKKQGTFSRSRTINKLFHIGRFIDQYFKYRSFFAANDMANDFSISYRQKAKKEISDDISADSADIQNRVYRFSFFLLVACLYRQVES